jgi:predicted RNase H-like nuclease
MNFICGADGCKGGWVVVSKDLNSGEVSWRFCRTARQIVDDKPMPQLVAIDIPIGLTEIGPRQCDPEVRRMLGPVRGCSVFPAPIRPVLPVTDYKEACLIRFGIEGKKMSKQSFAIMPKIKEVDDLLRQEPALRDTFREVHPELCFYFMAGKQPVVSKKREEEGARIRYDLLKPAFGRWLPSALADRRKLGCAEDDILDAFAALWTAERIAKGTAQTIPPIPPRDAMGLRMEMVV